MKLKYVYFLYKNLQLIKPKHNNIARIDFLKYKVQFNNGKKNKTVS